MFRPAFDGQVCSLGYQVIDWIVEYGCHGPGDVQGDPILFVEMGEGAGKPPARQDAERFRELEQDATRARREVGFLPGI